MKDTSVFKHIGRKNIVLLQAMLCVGNLTTGTVFRQGCKSSTVFFGYIGYVKLEMSVV